MALQHPRQAPAALWPIAGRVVISNAPIAIAADRLRARLVPPSRTPISAQADPSAGWVPQILQRMRYLLWLKLLGVSAFMWIFFIGYFYLLRHPVRPVTVMPLTALDLAIGHQPSAFAAYVSLWLYVGIAPGLMLRLRELIIYGLWAAALCAAGLLVFYFLPTAVPPPVITADLSQHPGFALLQGVDAAGNACPSLHVATALFSAIWITRLLRHMRAPGWLMAVNWVWLLAIVYSTLAIKQHVVLDVVAGAALGGVFAWASLHWFPKQAWQRRA